MLTNEVNIKKTTASSVVVPFYLYASIAFLIATILLFISTDSFSVHYFQPKLLAITHVMALGWGTMIILGASHQLVPVIIEGRLYSENLAKTSFLLAAIGIPLLCYGFYFFNVGVYTQLGGILTIGAILSYLINLGITIQKSKSENIHALFIFASVLWLALTAIFGLFLLINFTQHLLPKNSLHYLSLHAHIGIVGWFLQLIIGVGSRLIPMFIISKYTNPKLLGWIFVLINFSLIIFVYCFLTNKMGYVLLLPSFGLVIGIILFAIYCYKTVKERIRKKIDGPLQISLATVVLMFLSVIILLILIASTITFVKVLNPNLVLAYGFMIFFGWITSIILGMTFKTLPFIIWNKVYHGKILNGKSPSPKSLFSELLFKQMFYTYFFGMILFFIGVISGIIWVLNGGAIFLILTAVFYNINVFKVVFHKSKTI